MMVSLTGIVYVQAEINWATGLAIPTFLMMLSCVVFFIGNRIYVKVSPQGSPLTCLIQTFVVAFKKRRNNMPEQPWSSLFNHVPSDSINSKLAYTEDFRFLNKAAILAPEDKINADGSAANPWNICSLQQVEEVKCVVRVIPIWISGMIYYIVLNQLSNYIVIQALQADRRLGNNGFHIPAASYNVYTMLSLTAWIPIYDRILVPFLRKFSKKEEGITMLQRIGIGIVLGIFTMVACALVETRRRTWALTHPTLGIYPHKGAISAMSGNWFIPQLILGGLSERHLRL